MGEGKGGVDQAGVPLGREMEREEEERVRTAEEGTGEFGLADQTRVFDLAWTM